MADQGAIQITPDGQLLIAVDAGSNQVSVLRIHFDGSLSLVFQRRRLRRHPAPDSIAVHGSLVYVANSGTGGSNYTGFRLFGGHLFQIPGSTVAPGRQRRRPLTSCSTAPAPSWSAPRWAPP